MERTPIETYHEVDGVRLCVFEWTGDGRPLFFAHATGFHARCWDQVVAGLPGRHCYAVDFRGHGRSDKPEPPYDWHHFGDDVAALVQRLGIGGAIGVGHSKGGHALVNAAAQVPGAFAGLLLVDPVILPGAAYRQPREGGEHFAARRRNEWSSPGEMVERFRDREPFARWDPRVLQDYCEHGLLPNPNGDGYVLACPPEVEASIYGMSLSADIYDRVAEVRVPVTVLRARERSSPTEATRTDMSSSPTAPDLAAHFANGRDVSLPQYSHFLPMEAPEVVARYAEELEARIDG